MVGEFIIFGGNKLKGEVTISGAKNAVIAMIPAALLVDGVCRIENVPYIKDIIIMLDLMKRLGAEIKQVDKDIIEINCCNVQEYKASYEMVKKIRASYYLVGALLGRLKKAEVSLPGGCNFGTRPIDQHIKGFEALGARTTTKSGLIKAEADELIGAQIYMDLVSVGATINIMIAAVKAKGTTIIENAAKEPHIVDLANFLNSMGADVRGAGTDIIKIRGTNHLQGGTYCAIPDQIEAGTFMIAAAACGGDVTIKNIIPKHMEPITAKLIEMGTNVEEYDDSIRVQGQGKIKKTNVKTLPYPGFPTDLQPLITAVLTIAEGTSIVTEGVWDSRFQYVDELKRMGANITVEGRAAIIEGVKNLSSAPVKATDLRAGAAMVVAGLMAEGKTQVHNIEHIDRGYEALEEKLLKLGANIIRHEPNQ